MPRVSICIVCAILTTLFALLLMLAPSSALADGGASKISFGDGENVGTLNLQFEMIGTNQPLGDFKAHALVKWPDGTSDTKAFQTDAKGNAAITLKRQPERMHVYPYGKYVIPDAWANVPVDRFKDGEYDWEVLVRQQKLVTIEGRVTIDGYDEPIERASIVFAPLDVREDGSDSIFDVPASTATDENGRYSIELPAGYYRAWSNWTDRSTDDWKGFVRVVDRVTVFKKETVDFKLNPATRITGKVIDARTGEGMAAYIDLYTNPFFRQLRNDTADGETANEFKPDGSEVFWPKGTFKIQAYLVNPERATVVIRPADTNSVIKVLPDVDLTKLVKKGPIEWTLFEEEQNSVEMTVQTQTVPLPIAKFDVTLVPRKLDVERHLWDAYRVSGYTDDHGKITFRGLAKGSYDVFGWRGSATLGILNVTDESKQVITFDFKFPFAYGSIKYDSGEVCRHAIAFIKIHKGDDVTPPNVNDAFQRNEVLRKRGTFLLSLPVKDVKYEIVMCAQPPGKEVGNRWITQDDFQYISKAQFIQVDAIDAYKLDFTLTKNPNYKPDDD